MQIAILSLTLLVPAPRQHALQGKVLAEIRASATTGVAPLAVFFDALGSELRSGTPHDARYEWTFSDPSSIRPKALGFCAAHVFEKPGTYVVALDVADKDGNSGRASVTVKVQDFVGTTIWVSEARGNDKSDGKGADKPVRSFDRALALLGYKLGSSGPKTAVRVLFERGGTFTTARGGGLPQGRFEGPIVFGAYGPGPRRPVLVQTGDDPLFRFGESSSGVRVMDLEMRGTFSFATQKGGTYQHLVAFDGGAGHLLYRCSLKGSIYGVSAAGSPRVVRSEITIAECTIEEMRDYGAYLGGDRLAVLDNHFEKVSQMHVLRVWYARKMVIVGNELLDPSVHSGLGRHALKVHSFAADGRDKAIPTEWVWIAENVLRGSAWPCAIAPENKELAELVSNVVFERNLVLPDELSSAKTNQMVLVVARDVTVRGNVFVGSDRSPDLLGVAVQQYPNVPAPERVRLLGNTLVHLGEPAATQSRPHISVLFAALRGTGTREIVVQDNLVHAPAAGMPPTALVATGDGFDAANLVEQRNLMFAPRSTVWASVQDQPSTLAEWQAKGFGVGSLTSDPRLVAPKSLDLRLEPGSPARAAGTTLGAAPDVVRPASRPLR